MYDVDIELEVVTPMFSGGADISGGPAEFRIPELKAAMRFWWRAFQPEMTIGELYKKEADIFGSTEQSGCGIVPRKPLPSLRQGNAFSTSRAGVRYLWFFCTQAVNQEGRKAWMKPGETCALRCHFRSLSQAKHVLTALWLAENFGGLGFRGRRGAGCFRVRQIHADPSLAELPKFICDRGMCSTATAATIDRHYMEGISSVVNLFGTNRSSTSPYTAATTDAGSTAFKLINRTYVNWEDAAHDIGSRYMRFRNHQNGSVNQNLARDIHNYASGGTLTPARATVEKATLGIPIRFRFSGGAPTVMCEPDSDEVNRRASPLFIHIGKVSDNGPYWANVALLWSDFLPPGVSIRLKREGVGGVATVSPPVNANYAVEFINSLDSPYVITLS